MYQPQKLIVGIDEVGRGAIAGPVMVGICVVRTDTQITQIIAQGIQQKLPLRDSKKLTKRQRTAWRNLLQIEKNSGTVDWEVSAVDAGRVDQLGIGRAIATAITHGLKKFNKKYQDCTFEIFLDGGLHAPDQYTHQTTVIKGDEKIPIISLASIVAKTERDSYMQRLETHYPHYGFSHHVGYGTKKHYAALQTNGIAPIHRKTFLKSLYKGRKV